MKLANLWYYFLGEQVNAASAEFTFDADAVGTVLAPAQEVDDSRGYILKRHAVATVGVLRQVARVRDAQVSTGSVTTVSVFKTVARSRDAKASATSTAQGGQQVRGATIRPVTAIASSSHVQAPTRARVRVGNTRGSAAVLAFSPRVITPARLAASDVHIGIDLVEQELEEILFLLEVA